MGKKLRWRTVGVVAAALTLVGGGAGIAYGVTAQVTASSDVITACVSNSNGMVRIVSDASQCRATEHPVELAASQAPRTVSVDCATGGSIGQILADEPVIPPLTIDITGTCTEAVAINRDNVTLRAASSGAGISAPTSGDTALSVTGTHIALLGLTLTGGGNGLFATDAASISAENLHVTGAATGVHLQNSASAALINATVDGFINAGVEAMNGASVQMSGGDITGTLPESRMGVHLFRGGSAEFQNVHITDCGHDGVQVTGSSALINSSIIEHNTIGLLTSSGGNAQVSANSVIQDNGQLGAGAQEGSTLEIFGSTVENNGGDGVIAEANGTAVIHGSTIRANNANGVAVTDTSIATFTESNNEIVDNGGYGIFCQGSPAVAMIRGDPGTVADNTLGENNCPTA